MFHANLRSRQHTLIWDRQWNHLQPQKVYHNQVNGDGGCYVETSNIDGETNLKIRECEPALAEHVRDAGSNPDPFKHT